MKKIILGLGIGLIAGFSAFAQPEVDTVDVGQNGIERMIIEKLDAPASVGTDFVRYRVFVDMEPGFGYQLTTGTNILGEMNITTTGTWYNTPSWGVKFGDQLNSAALGIDPDLVYDCYVTSGGSANDRIAVPYAENVDGYTSGTPVTTQTTPGLDLSMFESTNSTDDFQTSDGTFNPDPAESLGGVTGPNASNIVMIGQFTTDGDFEFDLNIQTYDSDLGAPVTTTDIMYSSVPNLLPTIDVVTPEDNDTVDKNQSVTIGAHAQDADGTVDEVEFFVNGTSVGSDLTGNGQTDPLLPTHTINWTAVGSTVDIYAVATDNSGESTQSATISITVDDPNPTIVSVVTPTAGTYDLNDIFITADASDADEPVSMVEFLVDGSVVGTDNDGTNGWSTVYSPSEGTVDITARATNSASVTTTSSPVSVEFANASPNVSISSPVMPFDLVVGNDTTFVATASDPDGTVSKVDFLIGGSVVHTDNDGTDGFEYTFTANNVGERVITARATDNNGAETTSLADTFNVIFPIGGPAYAVENVVEFCSASDVFCMPVVTTGPVADVMGYDVEMKYDESKVTPTGVVIVAEDLIGDRDWTSYSYNIVGDSIVRFSLFINGSAPSGTTFSGEGQVFCIQFSRNYSYAIDDTATFEVPLVSESYETYVIDQEAIAGTYVMIEETEFNGSLSFWSDNSPIKYETGVNLITEITGSDNPSVVVTPDENGEFVYDVTNGHSITISRDIPNTTDVQSVINGYDAYLTSKVSVGDVNYRPNVYQIIAMDVNRDGRVSAGDITQIEQRAVGQLDEFAQDWVFVTSQEILSNLAYRISENFPHADGSGYDRLNVPSVPDQTSLDIQNIGNCPVINSDNFKGVMLGDVDGSYAEAPESPELKSTSAKDEIIIDLTEEAIYVSCSEELGGVDIQLELDESIIDISVEALENLNVTQSLVGNTLKVTSRVNINGFKSLNTDEAMMSLNITSDDVVENTDMSSALAMINGKPVELTIVGSTASTNSIDDVESTDNSVYPNPANDVLNVVTASNASVSIYNATGIMVAMDANTSGLTTFDVSELAPGMYVVKVVEESKVSTYNVIVE
jgi:hypothetical protein